MEWTPTKGDMLRPKENATGKKQGYRKPTEDKVTTAVRKALNDAVKWATALEIDGIVDAETGLTLRQFLTRDKARELECKGSVSFGGTYYKDLKRRFCAASKADAMLEEMAKNVGEDEEESEGFIVAFASTLKTPPNRSAFRDYVETTDSMLACETIATAQALCELSPTASTEQLHLCISILRCFERLGSFDAVDGLLMVLKPVIENILLEVI
eukprot:6164659-Amphidinium_carterae.2